MPNIQSVSDSIKTFKATSRLPSDDLIKYLRDTITAEDLDVISHLPQGSELWKKAREGRITASVSHQVLHYKNSKTCIDKILGKGSPVNSVAIDHGHMYEPVARAQYTIIEKKNHKNFKVEEYGLIVDPHLPSLAASPDGIVSCACHGKKLIEIKCSYKHKDIHPHCIPETDSSYHVESVDGKFELKKKSPWYSQVQFQMGVINIKSCDLVLHTLKDIAIIPIEFDQVAWEELKDKALSIFTSKIVPQLMEWA